MCEALTRAISVRTETKELVEFNALRLTPIKAGVEPMYLATTLPIDTKQELTLIVRLYSWRWGIVVSSKGRACLAGESPVEVNGQNLVAGMAWQWAT